MVEGLENPDVFCAAPDFVVEALVIPKDPRFAWLWSLDNNADADIDAREARSLTTGSRSVVVGVIDTGNNTAALGGARLGCAGR